MTDGELTGNLPEPEPAPAETKPFDYYMDSDPDYLADLPPEEQLSILATAVAQSRKEIAETREMAQRAQADLENFRKRAAEEYANLRQDANRRLIISLLPVIDELELAINHSDGPSAAADAPAQSLIAGVKLIHRKVYGILESEGLSKIETVGALFDPLQHEAVGVVDSTDQPSGYVVEAVRNGYRLRDRVIQAAQVVVAR